MPKRNKLLIILGLMSTILFGIGIMIYPMFSSWYSELTRSEIHTAYQEIVEVEDTDEIDIIRDNAISFNNKLFLHEIDSLDYKNNGYFDQLDPMENGIMGYVSVPKINITLPIYHTTEDAALDKGAGHMPQSSLPVGGSATHCVISAHTGMASSPLFSDLELMEVGDIFKLEVLGEVLTYEVDQIKVVDPYKVDDIKIIEGKDYCTLVTCTPYGVNTHRLLVRGSRIPTPVENIETEPEEIAVNRENDSVWQTQYIKSIIFGSLIAVLFILAAIFIVAYKLYLNTGRRKEGIPHEK